MTCAKVRELMSAFADGELTGRVSLQVRQHMNACPACADEWEMTMAVKEALALPSDIEPDPDFEARLVAHVFAEETSAQRRPAMLRPRFVRFAMACAVVALAVVGAIVADTATRGGSPSTVAIQPSPSFDVSRDQAYSAASFGVEGLPVAIPAGYESR